jgi:hypothetical protein
MRHAWPLNETRPSLEEPLNIALQYLEQTGQALNYVYVSELAAKSIRAASDRGVTHKIALANAAIVAVEAEMSRDSVIEFPHAF